MTSAPSGKSKSPPQPYLSFAPEDMSGMRVAPAQLARIFDVSRQTVSQWIKRGTITLGPDGKIDPARAAREVVERADVNRLRARVFRSASEEVKSLQARAEQTKQDLRAVTGELTELRKRLQEAEAERSTLNQRLSEAIDSRDFYFCILDRFEALMTTFEVEIRETENSEEYRSLLGELHFMAEDGCHETKGEHDTDGAAREGTH